MLHYSYGNNILDTHKQPLTWCRRSHYMRGGWWKGAAKVFVKIWLQHFRRLLLPGYFALFSKVGNKTKKTTASVEHERPSPIINDNCQISFSDPHWRVRRLTRNKWPVFRSTRDSKSLGGIQGGCRRTNQCRQIAPLMNRRSRVVLYLDVPQETAGHHIGDFQIPIVCYGELR